jgi:flagellar M-ring protein FliF
MDFLNKAYAQVADLFRSMTPGARITAALLAAVVVISLAYLFTHPIGGPSSDLMHGVVVSPDQMQEMEAAFGKANLSGYVVRNGQIFVPRGQEAAYMGALADAKALPPNFGSALRQALSDSSPFESPQEAERRFKIALQDTLSLCIRRMSGIRDAYVLYDSNTASGLGRQKILTASVTVKPAGSQTLDAEQVASIRNFVAGSIACMKPENVTVFDQNGRSWCGDPEGGGSAEDDRYLKLKQTYEKDLKGKILGALAFVPNVTVETSFVLDPKKRSKTREVKHDPKALAAVRTMSEDTSRTQESANPAGPAGFRAQQPNMAASLGGGGSGGREEEKESKQEVLNVASGQETETELVGLTPKLAKVSVGIPVSYFKIVWQEANPDKKEGKGPDAAALEQVRTDVIAKIKNCVALLLPPAENVNDPKELVAVTDFQDLPFEMPPEPSAAKSILTWLGNSWGMLGMIGLAGVSLLMLRSLIKGAPAASPSGAMTPTRELESPGESPRAAAHPPSAAARLRRFSSGPSLRDELSVVVKEDPDTAANILRNWIGQVG